jgi:prolyl-tRNA synthetase
MLKKVIFGLNSVRYDQHKTQIKIISSADSPEKAMDKLRGETLYVGFLDEWEYVTYMDSMLAGAAPAFRSARNIAKQTGQRTCIMYASTPGNLDTPEGKVAQRIIDNTPPFSEKFYDLTEQEIENMMSAQVDPNDPDKKQVTAVYIEYDWKQLRKTEEWVREQYNDAIDKGKIDFMATDAIGREHQLATAQLDFVQPGRFGLEYVDADNNPQVPVMIHCAMLGSIERFLSVFIEHTAGWFPFWAAPEQVRILTINDTVSDYVDEIVAALRGTVLMEPVRYNELRFTVDGRNESLGKKIREATSWKIPVQLIVGPKDKEAKVVSVRTQHGEQKVALSDIGGFLREI